MTLLIVRLFVFVYFFVVKVRFKVFKFEFYQFKLQVESLINLQLTG